MATIDVRFTPDNLQLGCVPAVNLFPHRPDPIRLTQHASEYPVVADARSPMAYEVYSIGSLSVTSQERQEAREYVPFYGVQHGRSEEDAAYWHMVRRESIRKNDPGTDVFVRLVDASFQPTEGTSEVVHIEALCTNRDLPARLPFGDPSGDFQLEGRPEVSRIVCLRKPTAPLRAPMQRDARWRVVSHLALNHLSLSGGEGRASDQLDSDGASASLAALREILRVYDFTDSPAMRQRIAGLVGLRSRKVLRRTNGGGTSAFARGLEVELEFDESQYAGSGALLFAMVLEQFLGLYASVNSFVQTVAISRQREEPLKRWAPRAGEIRLL
jgi:type VI secretion system protein ImpG